MAFWLWLCGAVCCLLCSCCQLLAQGDTAYKAGRAGATVQRLGLTPALCIELPHASFPHAPQGGERAFAFSSGMSALAAVTRLLSTGDHVVAGDDLYGGTSRLLSRVVPAAGIEVSNVDTSNLE